jgi:hypothetical protein
VLTGGNPRSGLMATLLNPATGAPTEIAAR